ncbi:hypothetical protein P2318_04685 [Myxococcaceae bacterium GXIMD 01537]
MSGPLLRFARWLRLLLACLALAGSGTPAHALPDTRAVVTASLTRRAPDAPREAASFEEVPAPATVRGAWVEARGALANPRPPERAPGPPRRLFIAHRALLR